MSTIVSKQKHYDYLAPDSSEIRLLLKNEHSNRGSLCHCTLPPQKTSIATKHKSVEELWYFIAGKGELWLKHDGVETVHTICNGLAITIHPNVSFQFRNLSNIDNLEFIVTTIPHWPGADEAVLVEGKWLIAS